MRGARTKKAEAGKAEQRAAVKRPCQCGNPKLASIAGHTVTHREDRCTFTTPSPEAMVAQGKAIAIVAGGKGKLRAAPKTNGKSR